MTKRKIAVVTPDLSVLTGVSVVAKFLYEIISASENYEAQLISVSTSARDANSTRLHQPQSWTSKIQISPGEFQKIPYQHVGAHLTDIEFFRYRPRRALDELWQQFDLVQIVAGTAPWTLIAENFRGKVALQVATLTAVERKTMLSQIAQPKRAWLQAMSKINVALEKKAFARADAVFVENYWMREHLEKHHGAKIIFAPPGVDTTFFAPTRYCENGYLLSVARFADPRKNVSMLFRAYRRLLDIFGAAPKLVLAGQTAPSPSDLAEAQKLNILDRIEVLTAISIERLRELYQNAALFLLPSDEEGFGIVIVEAMACGLPVISTRCGGPEVLIENGVNGYLIPINDSEALAARTAELLGSADKRRQFGKNGRERAVERFSLSATGKVYLQTYDRLLNS